MQEAAAGAVVEIVAEEVAPELGWEVLFEGVRM